MIQELITYTIIAIAVGFAGFRFFKAFERLFIAVPKKRPESGQCGGCTTACSLKGLSVAKDCHTTEKSSSLVLH